MSANSAALIQAMRGPILLITLGVILTIDHMTDIDFWRTWPVLFIVFGVFKLVEAMLRRPPTDVTQGNPS